MKPDNQDRGPSERIRALALSAIGTQLAAGMIFFAIFGYFVGDLFERKQAGTLVGIFLGLLYGGYEVWKTVRRVERESGRPDHRP